MNDPLCGLWARSDHLANLLKVLLKLIELRLCALLHGQKQTSDGESLEWMI